MRALRSVLLAIVLGATLVPTQAQQRAPWEAWQRVQFPDGSGSIAVPPSWRITNAARAQVQMESAGGDAVAGGITQSIGPAQFQHPGVIVGPYLPPPQAFAWYNDQIGRNNRYQNQVVRILEVQPTAPLTQNGQTAYLLADMLIRGRPYRVFALVNTAQLSSGFWQYYMTMLLSPVERFPFALPVMLNIWRSWSISQGEMNRRTEAALSTMRETNEIMRSTSAILTRGPTPKQQEITGDLLRGEWVIEDREAQKRYKVTNAEANRLFESSPGRYRMLPADER